MKHADTGSLTRKQSEIIEFIKNNPAYQTSPPTLEELCADLGLRSRGSLHKHISALTKAGLIAPADGLKRGIRLTRASVKQTDNIDLPVLGRIAAGSPIEAITDDESLSVPEWMCEDKQQTYLLQVHGDSMQDDGILDGDWVVVRQTNTPRHGEIVVALIDNEFATLKRFEQQGDTILLHPANAAFATQRYERHRVTIQGAVVGQMRKY